MNSHWLGLANQLIDLIWSPRCLICDRRLAGAPLCTGCLPCERRGGAHGSCIRCATPIAEHVPLGVCEICRVTPSFFRYQRYAWRYEGVARETLRIMKYRPSRRLCTVTGARVASSLATLFPLTDWDIVVPLPASRKSLRTRGFNQCIIIGRAVAKIFARPLVLDALEHRGGPRAQASLPHAARLGNVARSFLASSRRVAGQRVLLIDDVCTTGATSAAAGRALLDAGASTVDLFTLARAAAWEEHRDAIRRRFG